MRKLLTRPELLPAILLLVALVVGNKLSPQFLDFAYLLDKVSLYAPTAILAIAMTFVIIGGQIDLSVASMTVLVSVVAGKLYAAHVPMPIVIVLALVFGCLLGLFNAILVSKLKLPALVATLGTLALYRGLAQVIIKEESISGFPDWFAGIDYIKVAKIPIPVWIVLVVSVLGAISLSRTSFGRKVIALGTNESASLYSGLRTERLKGSLFVIAGFAAGLAGLVLMSELQAVDYKQMKGGELLAITSVVLGGTSIYGGKGSVWGTFLAILLLVVVRSAMGVVNVQAETQLAIVGSLLIVSVLCANLLTLLANRQKR